MTVGCHFGYCARGRRVLVVPVRLPGAGGRATARGALLPGADAALGTTTFDAWLAARDPGPVATS